MSEEWWGRSASGVAADEAGPVASRPGTIEDLLLELEDYVPSGPLVAAWRDGYAASEGDEFKGHIDLCLEYLEERGACWSCGNAGVTEHDDLLWCRACLDEELS